MTPQNNILPPMFGQNVVKSEFDPNIRESPMHAPYGTFFVPTTMQNFVLRPPSRQLDDVQPFSNQFMSAHDLGSYTLLSLSPAGAAVDPCLRADQDFSINSPLAKKNSYNARPRSSHPLNLTGNAPPPMGRALTIREPRRTKRYQYWTQEEDELVRELREGGGWTWKGISGELHRRLGGDHTWQAVQMRYLRTEKNRPMTKTGRATRGNVNKATATPILGHECQKVTLNELQKAVESDWDGRWLRISAKLGADINKKVATECAKRSGCTELPPCLALYNC